MTISFPSKICEKSIAKSYKAVECDTYKLWVQIKSNKINKQAYNLLMENDTAWYQVYKIYFSLQ